jgi:acetate kinase
MATRSGSVDPGLILWLQRQGQLTAAKMEEGLEHRAGLLGISGRSGDMRQILAGAEGGDPRCQLAFDAYSHRLAAGIAALAASLGGLDVVVFTGGVGEHAADVRSDVARRLSFLGLGLDEAANRSRAGDADISSDTAQVCSLVVEAREDLEIVAGVRAALDSAD